MNPTNLHDRSLALVIYSLRRGGAEKVLSALANALAEEGARVRLLTLASPGGDSPHYLDPRVETVALGIARNSPHFLSALVNNFRGLRRLRRALREGSPDAIVAFTGRTNVRVLLAAAGLGIPVIVSERSHPRLETLGVIWRAFRRLTYPRARFIVAPTARAGLALRFGSADRLRTIPNPVEPCTSAAVEARDSTLVAMGRFIPRKGFDLLIRSFHGIAAQVPGWSLRIYGEGPEEAALRRLVKSLGLEARVRFEGVARAPHEIMRRAGIFVLPSRYEGFPNVLCEAMACGAPVVAADCEFGPREILADARDGILVPAEDAQALGRALLSLIEDPRARAEHGRRAARAMARYAPENIFPAWRDLVAESLRQKILVVAPSLRRGGAERAVSWLTRAWHREHPVSLAVFNGAEKAYEPAGEWIDLGLPPGKGLLARLILPVRRVAALRKLMRRARPDRVFGFMESASLPLLLAALSCGMHRKVTVSVRGNPDRMPWAHRMAVLLLYGCAGRIACVSRGAARRMAARLPYGAGRVETLYSSLDLEEIRMRAAGRAPLEGAYFFAAGRLVPGKDFERMIRVFAQARCEGAQLVIAGDGPERARLEALVRSLDLSGRVRLVGALDNPFAWMRGALAFLMTSRHEGFPMVLIESLACGTPFIAFDCDFGPREAAPGDRAGFVVPLDDDAAFADRMERLASDSALRESMRRAAEERAADFSLDRSAALWLRSAGVP
jgi:GalNAc-alpha-(1->4)-GalNAc-alpha-(1->3)-diNAcBac-PP-undecaprenol alpha-1,4-N-acetyl-D-galactosaminyltransferase